MRRLPLFYSFLLYLVLAFYQTTILHAGESAKQVPSADVRWAAKGPGGAREFERHVVPLLGKLGCNNRARHGSFQGQNGFRLSLFGHDPQLGYTELAKEDSDDGPRVNLKQPAESLALYKPTHEDKHEGGERMKTGDWRYRLLHALGIDHKKEYHTPTGRPVMINRNGNPIRELFA